MRGGWRSAAAAAALLAIGCAPVRGALVRERAELSEQPGAYVTGEVVGLSRRAVLEARDFSYAVELSRFPTALAYLHLGAKDFQLGLAPLDPAPAPAVHVPVNESRHDVESLAFSPDGARVAVGSRDGTLRIFDRATAKQILAHSTGEPLTAVAWSPSGELVAAGVASGSLLLFDAATLELMGDTRAHTDELRALAFDDGGTLYSGGWDKQIRAWRPTKEAQVVERARVPFARAGQLALIAARVGGGAPAPLAYDARAARTAITGAAARAAGIDPAGLVETVEVGTAGGPIAAPLAREVPIELRMLRPRLDVVICDACVPPGAAGVLGADFLERFAIGFDEGAGEAIVTARETGGEPRPVVVARPGERLTFPHFVNDLTVDRKGEVFGVAFGETKAERTLEIYQREKKGLVEPLAEGNAAARVEARTGKILDRHVAHHGIVSTAAISPDGRSLASGGWDKRLLVHGRQGEPPVFEDAKTFGWSVRRVRFSPDGRYLAVAAWTPQIPRPNADSDPAVVVYDVRYEAAEIAR